MSHVVVIGAGAIGSHLVSHLARLSLVTRLTIIDRDRYEPSNVRGQQIEPRHAGRAKARLQATLAQRIAPGLDARAWVADVEDLPLGRLRADVICAAVDSRRSRLFINQAAFRLGVPWIDAGVSRDSLLARVRVHTPDAVAACLECGWDRSDYDLVEQTYPCAPTAAPAPTHAPSALAALAAALQAIECEKVLSGRLATALVGREILTSAEAHTHYVTAYPRSATCLMPDHEPWRIDPLPGRPSVLTLTDVAAAGGALRGADEGLWLAVAGQRFVTELRCRCGYAPRVVCLTRTIRGVRCQRCDGVPAAVGASTRDRLPLTELEAAVGARALDTLGIQTGDVLTLGTRDVEAHVEVGRP